MLKTSDFDYNLPPELIAQVPLSDRSASRLLVLDKQTGKIKHRNFTDIFEYFNEGDCLVLNNTRVIPARLIGRKTTGGAIEVLLLKRRAGNIWDCIGKNLSLNTEIIFSEDLSANVIEILENGNRLVEFFYDGIWEEILDRLGQMPLPPYIKEKLQDKERYQTVYSKEAGSAAAPTAGLHWTQQALDKVSEKGVNIAELTLHVGLGTFRPVADEDFEKHKMHSEWFSLDEKNAEIINNTWSPSSAKMNIPSPADFPQCVVAPQSNATACSIVAPSLAKNPLGEKMPPSLKRGSGKIIACGTTTVRVLETIANEKGKVKPCSGETNIFINPPYQFKMIDALITNFHLPKSTLLMLVAALAGRENILNAYNEAIKENYRFFSFGDAMLII